MNRNIEIIIPGKLAAVKFSYIPFISEINYNPVEGIKPYSEYGSITDQGMLLLNKDIPSYETLKKVFMSIMPLSYAKLNWQRSKLTAKQQRSLFDEINLLCIELEQERRKKRKEVKKNGNN